MRLAGWAETASPHALDGALRRAMKRLQRIEHDLGRILRQVLERRLYRELGFGSFERYVEERVDISPRTARRWVQMARLGPAGSAVANAFRDGLLTPKQASLVSEVVPPAQQPEAIAFAQGVTLRRLEDELGARDTARDAITFTAPPEAANVFLLALEAARLHLEAEKQTKQSTTEALLWMLDHVIAAWIRAGSCVQRLRGLQPRPLPLHRAGLHRAPEPPVASSRLPIRWRPRRAVESHDALRVPSPAGHPLPHHALQRARAGGAGLRAGPAGRRAAAAAGPRRGRAALGVRPVERCRAFR